MLYNHWRSWTCTLGCHESFDSANEARNHLTKAHADISTPERIESLVGILEEPKSRDATVDCPLCKQSDLGIKEYARHVGRHQKDLSLFSLPPLGNDGEQDHEVSQDSEESDQGIEDEGSGSDEVGSEIHQDDDHSTRTLNQFLESHPDIMVGSDEGSGSDEAGSKIHDGHSQISNPPMTGHDEEDGGPPSYKINNALLYPVEEDRVPGQEGFAGNEPWRPPPLPHDLAPPGEATKFDGTGYANPLPVCISLHSD